MSVARLCRMAFVGLILAGFPAVFLLTGNVLPMIYVQDRIAHASVYALASTLALLGWGPGRGTALCIGLIGLGGLIEILQVAFPTGHQAEWGDVAANACGVGAGWLFASAVSALLARRSPAGR